MGIQILYIKELFMFETPMVMTRLEEKYFRINNL